MNKNILKHNFTEPKPSIIGGGSQYSTLTGGRNNTISSGDYTNTFIGNTTYNGLIGNNNGTTTISHEPIGTEEFRASATFTHDMAHTHPQEEIKAHLKHGIMKEVFENMVRDDMFEFWSNIEPTTMGEQINCRLKVVRPQNV